MHPDNQEKAKILVVDDDEHILKLITYNLKKAGYKVVTCVDGQQAVETFILNEPDLVVMDVLMPKLDGFRACKKMREVKSKKYVPIIISSAIYRRENYQQEAKKIGADDYLVKPFAPEQLLKKVAELLVEKRKEEVKQ